MGKPNVNKLPEHLRKDAAGYFLDYWVEEGGIRKRKIERLGWIPVALAKRILALKMLNIIERRFVVEVKSQITFEDAAKSFLVYSETRKKSFVRDGQLVAHLKAFFGVRALECLTLDSIEEYVKFRRAERPSLSNTTLNREIVCLKTIVNRAVNNGQLVRNPISGVKLFKETPRNRTLTPDEYPRLIEQCASHLKPIVRLAYVTGMRFKEVLRLQWEQIDFQNAVIVLAATDTKTQERREVPLDVELLSLLQQIPRTLGYPFVFTYKGKPIKRISTAFNRACERAKIENFRFHDLRRCALTKLRKAGVSDDVSMSISGHKTRAVFRSYDAIDRSDRKKALEKLRQYDTDMINAVSAVS
jgi:integrase